MTKYEQELENLITEVLLPGYLEYCRISGNPAATKAIYATVKDLRQLKNKKLPYLLQDTAKCQKTS